MTIVHYIPSINRKDGGTTAYMQLLSKALGTLTNLHVVTHRSEEDVDVEGATVHYISTGILGQMKKEWYNLLDELNPQVVHINCCWIPACAFLQKWAKQKGYPVVLTPHGMLEPWIMKRNFWTKKLPALLLYQKQAVKQTDCLHATADSERAHLLQLGYNKKVEVIPNGIEVDLIRPKTTWKTCRQLLFLSRVHEKKGIELLLRALAELKQEGCSLMLNIVGEGEVEYVSALKSIAKELGVDQEVIFKGGVYGVEKWEMFEQADLFVLPTYSENFGIVVAEALATGTPVITTTGTPWNILQEQHCGWWVDATTKDIKRALLEASRLSEKEMEAMGLNGRRLTEAHFSIQAVAQDFVHLYNRVLTKK